MSGAWDHFVTAAARAFAAQVTDPAARRSTAQIFRMLRATPAPPARCGTRLPACAHLDTACAPAQFAPGPLHDLAGAFRALEPSLTWYRRDGPAPGANAPYRAGHANAMIAGPRGLLRQEAVWLGVSLLAPRVRYPDHDHPPEETYLVLSEGEFFQAGRGWFTPGVGGSFYNPPGILHAMRAGTAPLFAFWALRAA